jgi:hypothetical protein
MGGKGSGRPCGTLKCQSHKADGDERCNGTLGSCGIAGHPKGDPYKGNLQCALCGTVCKVFVEHGKATAVSKWAKNHAGPSKGDCVNPATRKPGGGRKKKATSPVTHTVTVTVTLTLALTLTTA